MNSGAESTVPTWLWTYTAVLLLGGLLLLLVGQTWLGVVTLTVPAFGFLPLVVRRSRRRGDER